MNEQINRFSVEFCMQLKLCVHIISYQYDQFNSVRLKFEATYVEKKITKSHSTCINLFIGQF